MSRVLEDSSADVHFIEGLILNPHKYVLMTGIMTDGRDRKLGEVINKIGKWHKPWFYKHVDKVCYSRGPEKSLKGRIGMSRFESQISNRIVCRSTL